MLALNSEDHPAGTRMLVECVIVDWSDGERPMVRWGAESTPGTATYDYADNLSNDVAEILPPRDE